MIKFANNNITRIHSFQWSNYNRGDKATRLGFGEGLAEAGDRNKNLIGLGADITASVGMNIFRDKFPERFISWHCRAKLCRCSSRIASIRKIPGVSTYGVLQL